MRVLAIDAGINGAACLFVGDSIPAVEEGAIIDLPTVGADKQREVDVLALRDWMLQMRPTVAVIEQITAMPSIPDKKGGERRSMGATSAFNFGRAYQALKMLPLVFNVPVEMVTPARWKKFYGLKGGPDAKERSRQLALQKWPTLSRHLCRVRDHQRAEALLLANYFWKTQAGEVEVPAFHAYPVETHKR